MKKIKDFIYIILKVILGLISLVLVTYIIKGIEEYFNFIFIAIGTFVIIWVAYNLGNIIVDCYKSINKK